MHATQRQTLTRTPADVHGAKEQASDSDYATACFLSAAGHMLQAPAFPAAAEPITVGGAKHKSGHKEDIESRGVHAANIAQVGDRCRSGAASSLELASRMLLDSSGAAPAGLESPHVPCSHVGPQPEGAAQRSNSSAEGGPAPRLPPAAHLRLVGYLEAVGSRLTVPPEPDEWGMAQPTTDLAPGMHQHSASATPFCACFSSPTRRFELQACRTIVLIAECVAP